MNLEGAKVRYEWTDGDRAVGGLFRHVDNSDPVKTFVWADVGCLAEGSGLNGLIKGRE